MTRTASATAAVALAAAFLSAAAPAAPAQARSERGGERAASDRDRRDAIREREMGRDDDRGRAESTWGWERYSRPTVRLTALGGQGYGEQPRVLLRTGGRGYVAVIHVAPSGRVEFLYPYHPSTHGHLSGDQRVTLRPRTRADGRSGDARRAVGYVYAIASREPLDFRRFQAFGGGWRTDLRVVGDRVEALERMTWRLVRRGAEVESTDWVDYRVRPRAGRAFAACRDRDGRWSRGEGLDEGRCATYLEYEDDGVRGGSPRLLADGGEVLELEASPRRVLRVEGEEEGEEAPRAAPRPRP